MQHYSGERPEGKDLKIEMANSANELMQGARTPRGAAFPLSKALMKRGRLIDPPFLGVI